MLCFCPELSPGGNAKGDPFFLWHGNFDPFGQARIFPFGLLHHRQGNGRLEITRRPFPILHSLNLALNSLGM